MNKLYKSILDLKYIPTFVGILIIILINWTFQSILYMDKTERIFKISIDLVLFCCFFIIFQNLMILFFNIIAAFIIAHSVNWILNGHIFALLKTFGVVKTKPSSFQLYIDELKERGSKEKSIKCIAIFGSISRELNETSDLDVRIVRKKGFINGIRSSLFVMIERSKAFFKGFPLDIYLLDNEKNLFDLREKPIFIVKDRREC